MQIWLFGMMDKIALAPQVDLTFSGKILTMEVDLGQGVLITPKFFFWQKT